MINKYKKKNDLPSDVVANKDCCSEDSENDSDMETIQEKPITLCGFVTKINSKIGIYSSEKSFSKFSKTQSSEVEEEDESLKSVSSASSADHQSNKKRKYETNFDSDIKNKTTNINSSRKLTDEELFWGLYRCPCCE